MTELVEKCKTGIRRELAHGNYECALQLICTSAEILYNTNQYYMDEELEANLRELALRINPLHQKSFREDTVLFYDGFGLNNRGLAQIYLKALTKNKKVIYIVPEEAKKRIPDIKQILTGHTVAYIRKTPYISSIYEIAKIIEQFCPSCMFFYAYPSDVVGTVILNAYKGKRFQINLTDHAFWLGAKAIDTCIEFRDYGAYISRTYRGIQNIVKIPFYPAVDGEKQFLGFPFEVSDKRVVFSGGNLSKTFDEKNTYYQIVAYLLDHYPSVVFWYAGSGNRNEIDKIIRKYPGRAFITEERPDLFQILQHCLFYLSTYPISGGLMMQYAAIAGIVPLTLRFEHDADGLLIDQEKLGVVYESFDELISEMRKIIEDEEYRLEKGSKLTKSVITQEQFEKALEQLLNEDASLFPIKYAEIETTEFKKLYMDRTSAAMISELIAQKRNPTAFKYFPLRYIRGGVYKLAKKVKKMILN